MNAIFAPFKSESLRRVFVLWSAWLALLAAGAHLPDAALIVATGGCFLTDIATKFAKPKA